MHRGTEADTAVTRPASWPEPPLLLRPLFVQFARPAGLLGRLAGRIMSKSDADDHWIVEVLAPRPDDRVLDLGCGPGVALGLIAERASDGLVCGVDPSPVMLRQAAARVNGSGRGSAVELKQGVASALPYPDGHFTKACTLHSVYFWPSLDAGLRELYRVLRPDGRLVVAVRMHRDGARVFEPSRYGYTDADVDRIVQALGTAGFHDVASQRREIGREIVVAITTSR